MTRITPAGVLSYLNTNWDVGTISKPTFVDQFENEMIKDQHSLGVNWVGMQWIPMTTGFASTDEEINTLTIHLAETTLANLNTVIDHVRALLKAKSLSGGHYMLTSASPMKVGNHYECFLTLEEVLSLQ